MPVIEVKFCVGGMDNVVRIWRQTCRYSAGSTEKLMHILRG